MQIGTLGDFPHCVALALYMEWEVDQIEGSAGIPLERCLVQRFSPVGSRGLERPGRAEGFGPALKIYDALSNKTYFECHYAVLGHGTWGVCHNTEGPALYLNDGKDEIVEYYIRDQAHRVDGPQTIYTDLRTGNVYKKIWKQNNEHFREDGLPAEETYDDNGQLIKADTYVDGMYQGTNRVEIDPQP
ncbi:hypothetical protein [Henriciella sp.]|uniref:hypothetical protein n=1 Tax=Henriciella sp. TaxID=1968823 RepID=UPI00185E685B|nr:hypothetical protein [Henriciella sp.]HIG21767.1 hypothetical protein [Henriciella sp.]